MYWIHGRSAAAEDAWRRAAEYARRANDRRQLTEILGWLASAALWGPTPAAEGIRRCADYLDEVGNHPRGQVVILNHLAGLYAMQDQVETAHATLEPRQVLPGHPRPDDDGGGHPARGLHRDARRRPGNRRDAPPLRLRIAQPDGRERQSRYRGGAAGQSHRGAGRKHGTTKPSSSSRSAKRPPRART